MHEIVLVKIDLPHSPQIVFDYQFEDRICDNNFTFSYKFLNHCLGNVYWVQCLIIYIYVATSLRFL